MVGHLVKLFDALDVRAHDRLLLLKDTDVTVDLSIAELLVIEVAQGRGHLILALMVEQDVERTSIVIDLKLGAHWLLNTAQEATNQDNVVNRVAVKLADIIGPRLRIHDHTDGHRRENLRLTDLTTLAAHATSPLASCPITGSIWRHRLLVACTVLIVTLLIHVKEAGCG